MGRGRGQLRGLKVVFPILPAQLEWREVQLLHVVGAARPKQSPWMRRPATDSSLIRFQESQRRRISRAGKSISSAPLRYAFRKAWTTVGSKSVPEPFVISSLAFSGDIASR